MHRTGHRIWALGAAAIASASMSACGGGGSNEIVARIAGAGEISKATLEHWIPIQARLVYSVVPRRPVPKGVVPDPPVYTACVAYLKTRKQKIVETGPRPTAAQLKDKCAQDYQQLRASALNLLIGSDWTFATATAVGMKVTDAEVKQRFELVKAHDLGMSPREYLKYLKYTGQTLADMMLRSKVQLIEAKMKQRVIEMIEHLPKGLTQQQQAQVLTKLTADVPTIEQWVAKTSCRRGYVTSSCRQYRGPLPPGSPS